MAVFDTLLAAAVPAIPAESCQALGHHSAPVWQWANSLADSDSVQALARIVSVVIIIIIIIIILLLLHIFIIIDALSTRLAPGMQARPAQQMQMSSSRIFALVLLFQHVGPI
uniref:Uncharacterized protein n=1 Tax=Anopheles atroparvus TaxID=41427 RepID=A0A182J2T3_ANOAO